MNKSLFVQYAELDSSIKALEEEKNALKPQVIEEIKKSGAEKIESDFGNFTIVSKNTYSYSSKVNEAETKLKTLKKKEEADGTAKAKVTEFLYFRSPSLAG